MKAKKIKHQKRVNPRSQTVSCQSVLIPDSHISFFHRGISYFPSNFDVVYLATMPRSGTWYMFYLFESLNAYLNQNMKIARGPGFEIYEKLNIVKAHVHSICPGFVDACTNEKRQLWDALSFVTDGFNFAQDFLEKNDALFSPLKNNNVKIVYLYRNPLDQIVSFYFHAKEHVNQKTVTRVGNCDSPSDYLKKGGLESYIKQFYTYAVMKQQYPDNILMVKYEDLKTSPKQIFSQILSFCNVAIDSEVRDSAIDFAISQSSSDNIAQLERSLGGSLAGDQQNAGASHMRGGSIGKWKQHLKDEDKALVLSELKQLGISEDLFMFD